MGISFVNADVGANGFVLICTRSLVMCYNQLSTQIIGVVSGHVITRNWATCVGLLLRLKVTNLNKDVIQMTLLTITSWQNIGRENPTFKLYFFYSGMKIAKIISYGLNRGLTLMSVLRDII